MKKSIHECRVNAVAAEKIMIETRGAGQTNLIVESVLLGVTDDSAPVFHGRLRVDGNWPPEVVEALNALKSAIEDHLVHLHFKDGGKRHGSGRGPVIRREPDIPAGLGGSGLADSEEVPEQL